MSKKCFLSALLSLTLCLGAAATPSSKIFREALNLYRQGMYERAGTLFRSLESDPLAQAYCTLCAGKLGAPDYMVLLEDYEKNFGASSLSPQLHYQAALNYFDQRRYPQAAGEFDKVTLKELDKAEAPQYIFKKGFCAFSQGLYPQARELFLSLEDLKVSDYTAPARYALGYMAYTQENFSEALGWFLLSVRDKRFEDLCNFYIIDCHFMQNDYLYVVDRGPVLYERVPRERQAHLSRIISESYLVLGDNVKAREYYEKDKDARTKMADSDYFYAGSIMYALHDYKGAIENFESMKDRADSIGQIASYQLGNSYIQQRNKVSALNAFKEAADLDYDPLIKEDACFNHAKLAFDINADGTFFEDYLRTYGTTSKGERIYQYMALSRLVGRDYTGAIEIYDKITNPDPDDDRNYRKANYLRAAELIRSGAWSSAARYLQNAIFGQSQHDGFTQLSRYWIAECRYHTGDYASAFNDFTSLYNISALYSQKEGALLPYNIGYCAFKQGQWEAASKWFDRYIPGAPAETLQDALERRADCDFALGNYKAAVESYAKAIQNEGNINSIYPYYQQALAYSLNGKRKDAIRVLLEVEKADVSSPMYTQALYELGRCCLDDGDNLEAVRVFRRLGTGIGDPGYVNKARLGEGTALTNLKDYDAALSCYKLVVQEERDTDLGKSALLAMESICQRTGRTKEYLEFLDANSLGSETSPADRERLYFNAAKQSFLSSDFSQASRSLDYYLENYPQGEYRGQAWYYKGECLEKDGEKEKAREAFATVMDCPGEGSYREISVRKFATISYDLQQYEDALGAYKALYDMTAFDQTRALALRGMMLSAYGCKSYRFAIQNANIIGEDPEALYIKAKSCLAVSEREEAFKIFKQLSIQPATAYGAEARYMLIQDCYDRGEFSKVSDMVYEFAPLAKGQDYYLARSFLTLGDAFVQMGNTAQARATYESLISSYVPYGEGDDICSLATGRIEKLDRQ